MDGSELSDLILGLEIFAGTLIGTGLGIGVGKGMTYLLFVKLPELKFKRAMRRFRRDYDKDPVGATEQVLSDTGFIGKNGTYSPLAQRIMEDLKRQHEGYNTSAVEPGLSQ